MKFKFNQIEWSCVLDFLQSHLTNHKCEKVEDFVSIAVVFELHARITKKSTAKLSKGGAYAMTLDKSECIAMYWVLSYIDIIGLEGIYYSVHLSLVQDLEPYFVGVNNKYNAQIS